jgi:ABC-type amino acid transport substrate-binding protein
MKRLVVVFIVIFMLESIAIHAAANTVKVGGYEFPPFLKKTKGQYTGMVIDLIDEMNAFQKKYQFEFINTSSVRRYKDFIEKKYDLIFFENIQWGWQEMDIAESLVFLKGGEVYITLADKTKDQTYFERLDNKSIRGFLGYHYGFADFNVERAILKDKYNAIMTTTHVGNILSVVDGRVDIAVVTMSKLSQFLLEHPEVKEKILISERLDQEYNHTILVRKNITPTVREINRLLKDMEKKGLLSRLCKKYGIDSKKVAIDIFCP